MTLERVCTEMCAGCKQWCSRFVGKQAGNVSGEGLGQTCWRGAIGATSGTRAQACRGLNNCQIQTKGRRAINPL